MGLALIALNASLREECNLYVFAAGRMTQEESSSDSCIQIPTPPKSVLVMNSAAQMRFMAASLLPRSEERCDPTNNIGTGEDSTMNDNAAEATAKLSVPMPTIIPFTPFWTCFSIALAIRGKCAN